jgi:hypothetical protein
LTCACTHPRAKAYRSIEINSNWDREQNSFVILCLQITDGCEWQLVYVDQLGKAFIKLPSGDIPRN